MTNYDLISAIGAAGCADLEHSERTRAGKRSRLGTRLLIVAAVIALLTTTVFAVPAFRNALFGARTNQISVSRIYVKDGSLADVNESWMDVDLDVRMDPAAPERVETAYVPMLPATRWEPKAITADIEAGFETGTLLQWENADGDYVVFRQDAWPDYDGDAGYDSVCTGFDAAYTVSEAKLGGVTVQRIVVEPSEKDQDGYHAEHPGLQKLYWSDGLYLFSMEVNYSMSDDTLAAILASIEPAADLTEYVRIEQAQVPDEPRPTGGTLSLDRVMYPETVPEGYTRVGGGFRQPNGGFSFSWLKEDQENTFHLDIEPELYEDQKMLWDTHYIADETMEREVDGIRVVGWQNGFRAQIIWRFDDADYTLKSAGLDRLSMEELLEIMEGLVPVENSNAALSAD